MTTYSIPRSWAVGFDQFFDRIESAQANQQSYPPHNVIKHSEDKFEIAIAVAGFSKDDLTVTLEKSVLTIEGKDNSSKDVQYLHKGIGTRKFKKSFDLAEHIKIEDVVLLNGILSIKLQKIVPEELKPKVFTISTEEKNEEKQLLNE